MATQIEACSDRIAAILTAVPDIGIVHARLRVARDEAEFLALFKTTIGGVPQIRGWMIHSPAQTTRRSTPSTVNQRLPFRIYGYRSVNADQSSEREFYALTESVIDALTAHIQAGDSTASTTPAYVALALPASVDKRGWSEIAKTKVHYAEISYELRLEKQVSYVA